MGSEFETFGCPTDVLHTSRRFSRPSPTPEVEFHKLGQMHRHQEFADVVEKLLQAFVVVHTHGNNYGGRFNYQGFTIPAVFEAPAWLHFLPCALAQGLFPKVLSTCSHSKSHPLI